MALSNVEIRDLMRQVYHAARYSTDRSTHNGAMLIDERGQLIPLVLGFNHHITGWEGEHTRPMKYSVTEHAERDIIYRAACHGVCTNGLTMIANWVACPDCARGIVLAGIRRVICHKQCMDRTPTRWKEMVDLGLEMLEKNETNPVEVVQWDGKVGQCENLNNGETWRP